MKTENIDLQTGSTVLAYELSKCCWSMNEKGKWYLSDLIGEYNSCKGNYSSTVKEKNETKNLFKL